MKENMYYGEDYKNVPMTSIKNKKGIEVTTDLYQYTTQIVNIAFYGEPSSKSFVLVDTGVPNSAKEIIQVAEKRFGENAKPKAIILTHGHFDHVGSIIELINYWNVPVYAHKQELPYLTGEKDYLSPDNTVQGGLVSRLSQSFPKKAIDLKDNIHALPEDFSVPFMPGFQWVHTPGHTDGHVSLFRESDNAMIAGDAFITVKQDYLLNVLMQKKDIYGPPRYFTTDWIKVQESINKLLDLKPNYVITGHGAPLRGIEAEKQLDYLSRHFEQISLPKHGKYVKKSY